MPNWEIGYQEDGTPFIPLEMGGEPIPMTRDNLWLYTFSPEYQEIDHAYLVQEERKKKVGYYMFRLAVPDFDELVAVADEHYFWHARGFKPSNDDIKAYAKFSAQAEERPPWLD